MGNSITLNVPAGSQFTPIASFTVTRLVVAAVNLIMIVAALIFIALFLIGGVGYLTSAGGTDKQASQRAQGAVTGAIFGLLIVFGIYAIVALISAFFGINFMTLSVTAI